MVVEFETNSGIICSILSSFGCVGLARSLGVARQVRYLTCVHKKALTKTMCAASRYIIPYGFACGSCSAFHGIIRVATAAVIIMAMAIESQCSLGSSDAAAQLRARASAAAARSLHARALQ